MGTEERILHIASLTGAVSVFFPWLSGTWLGGIEASFSGFESFTAALGYVVFLLHASILGIGLSPLLGGPHLVQSAQRHVMRLILASQATVLSIAALSVLTLVTNDYTQMSIRFGIYASFFSSLIATFYAFWLFQNQRRILQQEHFRHPDDMHDTAVMEPATGMHQSNTPVSTPPPPEPELHRHH